MDGSSPPRVRVALENADESFTPTRVRVTRVDDVRAGSRAASCVRTAPASVRAAGVVVERVGVRAESVTYRDASGHGLYACDNASGPREHDRRWCGSAYGDVQAGHLRDPRLDITCRTKDGSLVGFVWVEPGGTTRYVAVQQPGYTEVYEVAGGLPVRVATTTGVDASTASAALDVSEHAAAGKLLRHYELRAQVAG